MKISKSQLGVMSRLWDGCDLGQATTMDGGAWMQKDGLGRGGESFDVNANTFHSLCKKGLIGEVKYGFPHSVWTSTGKGDALKGSYCLTGTKLYPRYKEK